MNVTEGPPLDSILGVTALPHFAIVKSYENPVSIWVNEHSGASKPVPRELFLRLIDRHGEIHDFVKTIEPMEPGTDAVVRFDVGELDPPLLLTTQCGCISAWLFTGRVEAIAGNESWLDINRTTVRVDWQIGGTESPLPLMERNQSFVLGRDVIHYTYLHGNNGNADVKLWSPSGREIAFWQIQGRQESDAGHRSDGARPLEFGYWHLSMEGTGWFELYLDIARVRPEAWALMGIEPPAGIST